MHMMAIFQRLWVEEKEKLSKIAKEIHNKWS